MLIHEEGILLLCNKQKQLNVTHISNYVLQYASISTRCISQYCTFPLHINVFPASREVHLTVQLRNHSFTVHIHIAGKAHTMDNYYIKYIAIVCNCYDSAKSERSGTTFRILIDLNPSMYIRYEVFDENSYPFPNFNNANIEVWQWICNFMAPFLGHGVTYRCLD